ncbi:uncharacterized protein vrs [Drosophila tropicalis]|uniref:uncharacterized protein vrs n=1 Tax=Drosophila tropicalis TaxID=46794 RepID=UPI0035ABA8AD
MFNHNLSKKKQNINRNVFQALFHLHATGQSNFVQRDTIANLVKRQMSDQNLTNPSDQMIMDSLKTLTNVGVLAQTGTSEYGVRCVLQYDNVQRELLGLPGIPVIPGIPGMPGMPVPVIPTARVVPKPTIKRRLDPRNLTTDVISKESMSGGNLTKARKRWRTNNKRLPKPRDGKGPSKISKMKLKAEKNALKNTDNHKKLQAAKKYFKKAFNKIKREEQEQQKRVAVPVIKDYALDLSNKNLGHEHNSIKNRFDLKIAVQPSGPFQGMPHLPDQLPAMGYEHTNFNAIGNTISGAISSFDIENEPNTDNASTIGLCGSRIRVTNPFQTRWAPFWEREAGVNSDDPRVEEQSTWVPKSLPDHDFFGSPFN